MQNEFTNMVHEMLGYGPSDEIPETELVRLTNIYAYSPFIQYLYSRHLKEKDAHRYAASVAKTALYFSNPHWLNHQLRDEFANQTEINTKPSEDVLTETDSRSSDISGESGMVLDTKFQYESPAVSDNDSENQNIIIETEVGEDVFNEITVQEIAEEKQEINEPALISTDNETDFSEGPAGGGIVEFPETETEINNSVDEPVLALSIDETGDEDPEENGNNEYGSINTLMEEAEPLSYETKEEEKSAATAIAGTDNALETAAVEADISASKIETASEGQGTADDADDTDGKEYEDTRSSIRPLEKPLFKFNPVSSGQLGFEPLYTIDYFASQGIKLSPEEEVKDQLTNRLKSFTDWLKSMKKIHPEKLSREMDDKTEFSIKSDAEHSNDQSEVITETMAEVFVKQGLFEKALELYQKLSLLNPSKSDYFAAKISEIKAIGI